MVFPCGDFMEIISPSLSREGKLVIPIVLPKTEKVATLLLAQIIAILSGCKVKLVVMVAVEVASLIFHPFKLKGVDETFLTSMNSALGSPTTGDGSAMISVITTSN